MPVLALEGRFQIQQELAANDCDIHLITRNLDLKLEKKLIKKFEDHDKSFKFYQILKHKICGVYLTVIQKKESA